MSEEEKKELVQFVLDKKEEGKIVVMTFEGLMSAPVESIIKQPANGLLYDLNRGEETTLTFIEDPKWVNDFAVALVIRKLKSNLTQLEEQNARLMEDLEGAFAENGRFRKALSLIAEKGTGQDVSFFDNYWYSEYAYATAEKAIGGKS